jgi:hypothetical protein
MFIPCINGLKRPFKFRIESQEASPSTQPADSSGEKPIAPHPRPQRSAL